MNDSLINYEDQATLALLKSTVAVGATNDEFKMFIGFCRATGLNPFKKEIWFIKVSGRIQMLVGINGFRAIANNHPNYDGIEIGLIGKGGEYLSAAYPANDYIGAWSKCYRKDRRIPTEGIAMLADYDKGHSNWKTMRRVMIMKCAESVALRQSFPQQLNGLYTQEEMSQEDSEPATVRVAPVKALAAPVWLGPRFAADQEPLATPPVDVLTSPIVTATGYIDPPADVAAHVLESICKFHKKTIEQAYDADPEWVFAAVDQPKRLAKCLPIDQAALVEFVRLVRTDIRQTVESSLNKTLETEEKV